MLNRYLTHQVNPLRLLCLYVDPMLFRLCNRVDAYNFWYRVPKSHYKCEFATMAQRRMDMLQQLPVLYLSFLVKYFLLMKKIIKPSLMIYLAHKKVL